MNNAGSHRTARTQSILGLNAINFFQAEMVGVVLPALSAFLKEVGRRYDSIASQQHWQGALCFCKPSPGRLQIESHPVVSSSRQRQSSQASVSSPFPSCRTVNAGSTDCCLYLARYKASSRRC
jgi:hypothetical protein